MAGKKVVLVWNAKTPRGWRRFPARLETRGNRQVLLHGSVVDGGEVVQYDTGRYELRSYADGKMLYTPLRDGEQSNPEAAMVAWHMASRKAKGNSRRADPFKFIKESIDLYVRDLRLRKKMEMAEKAAHALEEFRLSCSVDDRRVKRTAHTSAITRAHVLRFHAFLRQRGNSERTIADKHQRVHAWLRFCKVDTSFLPPVPKYERKKVSVYSPAEIKSIRAAADPYMRMVIDLALKLGLREQEIAYAEWADVDAHHATFRVQSKVRKEWRFMPKDAEQRVIPVPADMLQELATWRELHPDTTLIVGNNDDAPEGHLLRKLKTLARNAELNCKRCEGCSREGALAECERWFLHKFRATYLTKIVRSMDLESARKFAGHSDIQTTQIYLEAADPASPETQAAINAIRWE